MRVCVLIFGLLSLAHCDLTYDYGLIIDAGSGGSRLYIYRWPASQTGEHQFIQPEGNTNWTLAIDPGISAFASSVSKLEEYLTPLCEFAKQTLATETARFDRFPIFLKATAGIRVLDEVSRESIMTEIRRVLSSWPFLFRPWYARCISGEEEGINGWLSVNYLRKAVFAPQSQVGVMDMGGASFEMTFIPEVDIIGDYFPLRLKGETLGLYTHSFLRFGLKLARNRMLSALTSDDAPCYPKGFNLTWHDGRKIYGSSSYSDCVFLAIDLLDQQDECFTRNECGPAGEYLPSIGTRPFVAIGHFPVTVLDELLLTEDASLSDIVQATRAMCELHARDLPREPNAHEYCFHGVWTVALLHRALGFHLHDHQILFRKADVGMIGAMVYEANQLPWAPERPTPIWTRDQKLLTALVIGVSLGVFAIIAIAVILLVRAHYVRMINEMRSAEMLL